MFRLFHHAIIYLQRLGMRALATACLALLAALLIAPVAAYAAPAQSDSPKTAFHAYYTGSVPKANAILKTAPTQVIVHFAESVNPQGSDVIVYDAKGAQVSTAPAQVDRADLTTMTVPMKADDSEIYFVEWHTVSASDGDPDIGGFNFLVNASASSVQAVQSANGTGTNNTTTTTSSSSGSPIWLTVLIAIVALLVGGGALYYAQRAGWAPAPTHGAASSGKMGS